jgi:hypothetical protein
MTYPDLSKPVLALSQDMSYSIKEKEPTLVCSDQDMSYSNKEKEPTLACSDQDMSYSTSVGSFSLMLYDKS